MDIQKHAKHYWRQYGTMNNIVIAVALLVAAGWAWGSVATMQRNFALQKDYEAQLRQLELLQLQVKTLEYEQNYYRTNEFKDYAARRDLGLANKGEKELILPPNSASVLKKESTNDTAPLSATHEEFGNLEQWFNFLSGRSADQTL